MPSPAGSMPTARSSDACLSLRKKLRKGDVGTHRLTVLTRETGSGGRLRPKRGSPTEATWSENQSDLERPQEWGSGVCSSAGLSVTQERWAMEVAELRSWGGVPLLGHLAWVLH